MVTTTIAFHVKDLTHDINELREDIKLWHPENKIEVIKSVDETGK